MHKLIILLIRVILSSIDTTGRLSFVCWMVSQLIMIWMVIYDGSKAYNFLSPDYLQDKRRYNDERWLWLSGEIWILINKPVDDNEIIK